MDGNENLTLEDYKRGLVAKKNELVQEHKKICSTLVKLAGCVQPTKKELFDSMDSNKYFSINYREGEYDYIGRIEFYTTANRMKTGNICTITIKENIYLNKTQIKIIKTVIGEMNSEKIDSFEVEYE